MNPEDIAFNLVKLNNGRLVGRTRLQKVAYLLDRSGQNSGFRLPIITTAPTPLSSPMAGQMQGQRAGCT